MKDQSQVFHFINCNQIIEMKRLEILKHHMGKIKLLIKIGMKK